MKKTEIVIDPNTQKNIDGWLNGNYDEESKKEVHRLLREDPEEALDAFYTHLSFGTGGLRGVDGVGTNRMNIYTVRKATQGLSNYLLKQTPAGEQHSVLISYDCRTHSRQFAEESAKVLAANGIGVFLYKELRPVALASFGVLYKKCTAGIMITASHNPPQYNGYKVYWSHGGQVLPPHDKGIIEEVEKTKEIKTASFPHPLITELNGEIDAAYIEAIRPLQLHPGDNYTQGNQLKVVYTSLHGAGITMVPRALKDWGFTNLEIVKEQEIPDGRFPTVKSPNPEYHETLAIGVDKLQQSEGDILLGTDPDTDRLGVVVRHEGKPFFFDGNQVACLLLEHICSSLKQTQMMPPKAMFIKTIVTTELSRAIAEHYQVGCIDVLTGFKYVGEKIAQWEAEKEANVSTHHYIFGGEESYGYLLGTHVRDKDAIISAACACEAALQAKLEGKTWVDSLYKIYQRHGIYREKLISLTYEGKEGGEKMRSIMSRLRDSLIQSVGDVDVIVIEDYLSRKAHHLQTEEITPLLLPKSDVLRFWLADQTKIVLRPSGTEPKIKLYCGVVEKHHHPDAHSIEKAIEQCDSKLDEMLAIFKKYLI
ncbi:MAG: phospho-sugar mutase [Chlamydiales bacterium]